MNEEMHQNSDNKAIPMTSVSSRKGREIRPDVYYYTNQSVNVEMVGLPGQNNWVLDELSEGLSRLAREFDKIAIPEHGKYVDGKE